MAIDFKKKLASRTITPKTNPIELYGTLDRKSVAGPLRPAQEIVLSEWYTKRRADKDFLYPENGFKIFLQYIFILYST